MKNLSEWLAFLEELHPKGQAGIELGLERVRALKDALCQKETRAVITVGGTNGKGSTCAYLESIYLQAGYRVGCYSSPHLLRYNERVRVNGVAVEDEELGAAFEKVNSARIGSAVSGVTYFEFGTLAAWEVFVKAQVDVVILEVGLGGRLDAVNIYESDCAVVTGIALDHTAWLGDTRERIGFEKAGIFRAGKPAVCGDVDPPETLGSHAEEVGAQFYRIGTHYTYSRNENSWAFSMGGGERYTQLPFLAMAGDYQYDNAATALAVIGLLEYKLPVAIEAIRNALLKAVLPGRFQLLQNNPDVVVDVAHNPQAVSVLADNLSNLPRASRNIAVLGMLADKDIAGALSILDGRFDLWCLCDLEGPRAASAEYIAQCVKNLGGERLLFASPVAAFKHAVSVAGENDRITAFGSFYTAAAVLSHYDAC